MNTFHNNLEDIINNSNKNLYEIYNVSKYINGKWRQYLINNRDLLKKRIKGICIKLSVLDKYNIDIMDILKLTKFDIIIDAEFDGLDKWIETNQIELNAYFNRLILTVQILRKDALNQIDIIDKIGKLQYVNGNFNKLRNSRLRILLVKGNSAYSTDYLVNLNAHETFAYYLKKFNNIILLGIGKETKSKIEVLLNYKIHSRNILELLGYNQIQESNVWSYLIFDKKSVEADSYIKRRNLKNNEDKNKFILQDSVNFRNLLLNHKLFVYIDIKSDVQYLTILNFLSLIMDS